MWIFYSVAALLLLLALVYWFMAVRIQPAHNRAEQQALAQEQVNTYHLRLKELAYEQQHDYLDEHEYQSSVNELKRQLMHDLSAQSGDSQDKQFSLFLPGVAFLVLFVAAFYWGNGHSVKLHDWQQTKALLPELGKRAMMNEGESLTAKELQQFALGLRSKLFDEGGDAVTWLILGRVTMALNDSEGSMLAFERAYKLDPFKPAVLLSYAQGLLMLGEDNSTRKAALLLSEVLKQQADNVDALLMVGYIAEQMQQIDKAKITWNVLLSKLSEDDPRRAFVQDKLAQINNPTAMSQSVNASPTSASVNGAKVTVRLSLSDAVKGKVPQGSTLFIYAKAAQDKPMPAAVIKLNDFEFPMTIELSDDHAMLPNYKLSTLDKVVVWGRVSKDGDIGISAGELQGQSQVFSIADTNNINVVINQIL